MTFCHYLQNDAEAAREAYDAFLAHYPYCYGYWRKYADYEKRKGHRKKCEEVSKNGINTMFLHCVKHSYIQIPP